MHIEGRQTPEGEDAYSIEDTLLLFSKAGNDVLFDITLVGGQALNFWADKLLSKGGDFLSGDVDFLGSAESADSCAHCWEASASFRKATLDDAMGSPNTAVVLVPRGEGRDPLQVDFLGNLIGPSVREVRQSRYEVLTAENGPTFYVMHPFHIMESRLGNAFYLGRKDEVSMGRLNLSFDVMNRFIQHELEHNARSALSNVEQVVDLALTPRGKEAWMNDVDVLKAIPLFDAGHDVSPLWPEKFVQVRWPQILSDLKEKRARFLSVMDESSQRRAASETMRGGHNDIVVAAKLITGKLQNYIDDPVHSSDPYRLFVAQKRKRQTEEIVTLARQIYSEPSETDKTHQMVANVDLMLSPQNMKSMETYGVGAETLLRLAETLQQRFLKSKNGDARALLSNILHEVEARDKDQPGIRGSSPADD
ncbi:MAG: hypothetical protein ACYCR3_10030 [Acidithiobacillus sp.]